MTANLRHANRLFFFSVPVITINWAKDSFLLNRVCWIFVRLPERLPTPVNIALKDSWTLWNWENQLHYIHNLWKLTSTINLFVLQTMHL